MTRDGVPEAAPFAVSIAKRCIDIVGVLALAPFWLPAIVVCSAAVRLTTRGPVFERVTRAGMRAQTIGVLKLRTTSSSAFSMWMRRTGMDELPQVWNVLVGDMSLIGPRPLTTEFVDLYSDAQRRRLDVRPGITGWAQVHGRNARTWPESFEFDLWYVEHATALLDLRIALLTLTTTHRRHADPSDRHEAKPLFEG